LGSRGCRRDYLAAAFAGDGADAGAASDRA